jgi:aminocarboxymuconate-semialdehyde decarboxylase
MVRTTEGKTRMTIVDFHNHYYPPAYLDAIRQGPSAYVVTEDDEGNPVVHSPGDKNWVVPGHRNLEARLRAIDAAGVDVQVVTFTSPGTLLETPPRSAELSRLVNDELAGVVAKHPDRFTSLATLPLNHPPAAAKELARALDDLAMPGAMLYGNVNGTPLSDERFWPIYERAGAAGAVLFIHPTYPAGVETMTHYWLMPLVGFLFDTTLAAAGLVFSGVVERFPGIKWVLGHLGGAIPYLAERLDRGYEAFPECRAHIRRPPSSYLKEFFYDTVNFDPAALGLAIEFAGVEHIVAGSDYPHRIGSLSKMRDSIAALDLAPRERALILGGNARRLLSLPQ